MTDIDIDFANRDIALQHFEYISATLDNGKKHNTGVYFHNIPYNPITKISTVGYKNAEKRGYFKIDFLNVHIYDDISNIDQLTTLMEIEPAWDLLLIEEFVNQLFHLNGHADILKQNCPTSVEQLAAVLAMIRPAKRYLIGKDWQTIMQEIWIPPTEDQYYFKKAHAISYAMAVVVQINQLSGLI